MRVRSSALFLCVVFGAAAADVQIIEQIVAKVNGDIITRGEIERTREALQAELRQQNVPAAKIAQEVREREKDALRDQIDQLLLVQKGKELNVNVDPEVNRELADLQLQSKITDPDKFHQYIHEQSGMSFEDFKQQLKNRALTQHVIRQEVGGRINIPTPELQKYYEEHKNEFIRKEQLFLREILVSTAGKTPEQVAIAEKKAKDLVARARKGEKFGDLARDNSDSETSKNYGELGWWKRGELKPELEAKLFKEKRGYVTDPMKVDNGFLILKVEDHFQEGLAPFEEVSNEISEKMYMPRMQPKIREYLTKLRQEAFLEIREGFVDSGAAPGKDTAWRDPAQLKPQTTTKEEVAARKRHRLLGIIPRHGKAAPARTDAGASAAVAAPSTAAAAATTPAAK